MTIHRGPRAPVARRSRGWMLATLGAAAILAAGCGSSGGSAGSGGAGSGAGGSGAGGSQAANSGNQTQAAPKSALPVDRKAAALVPPALRKAGAITVATSATYPPETSVNSSGQIVGSDPDLGHDIGDLLGVKFNFKNVTDAGLIPGLRAQRFGAVMTGAYVLPDRLQQVDFITYQRGHDAFLVKKGATLPKITGLSSLCGLTVAVPSASAEAEFLAAQNTRCGGHQITVHQYGDQNEATLAVTSGRAQVTPVDMGVAANVVKASHGALTEVGSGFGGPLMGIEVQKGSKLGPAIRLAVEKLISDGTYRSVLAKWGESPEVIHHTSLLTKPAQAPTPAKLVASAG